LLLALTDTHAPPRAATIDEGKIFPHIVDFFTIIGKYKECRINIRANFHFKLTYLSKI
jgi:hypothetical protein